MPVATRDDQYERYAGTLHLIISLSYHAACSCDNEVDALHAYTQLSLIDQRRA